MTLRKRGQIEAKARVGDAEKFQEKKKNWGRSKFCDENEDARVNRGGCPEFRKPF